MTFAWDTEKEQRLLFLKDQQKKAYKEIALELGTTISSVKHKYIRLNQKLNDDRHHHPVEKIAQIKRVIDRHDLSILETHAGYGNLSKVYRLYGKVIAHDIDKEKVDFLLELGLQAVKCDSLKEIHKYIYQNKKFDVIDLDSYGFPSRFFPHVFNLINDGFLFVTFPKMGVQQINKITKEHYRVFWDITLQDKQDQENLIHKKIKDYAFQSFRDVEIVDQIDLGRMFRFAYKVRKDSALNLVGLKVKGIND